MDESNNCVYLMKMFTKEIMLSLMVCCQFTSEDQMDIVNTKEEDCYPSTEADYGDETEEDFFVGFGSSNTTLRKATAYTL